MPGPRLAEDTVATRRHTGRPRRHAGSELWSAHPLAARGGASMRAIHDGPVRPSAPDIGAFDRHAGTHPVTCAPTQRGRVPVRGLGIRLLWSALARGMPSRQR